jgi:hypothetical protein
MDEIAGEAIIASVVLNRNVPIAQEADNAFSSGANPNAAAEDNYIFM